MARSITPSEKFNTAQEVFDAVATHLLTQKKAAREPAGEHEAITASLCRYRIRDHESGDMLKCAVGCLIPDDLYDSRMEGNTTPTLITVFPFFQDLLPADAFEPILVGDGTQDKSDMDEASLIGALQNVHDNWHPDDWPKQLRHTAKDFELSSKVLNEAAA